MHTKWEDDSLENPWAESKPILKGIQHVSLRSHNY